MSQIEEGKIRQTMGAPRMRLKTKVMWENLTNLALKTDGYEGQALVQIMEERNDLRNELCLRCGKYENKHKGACDGCRWEE